MSLARRSAAPVRDPRVRIVPDAHDRERIASARALLVDAEDPEASIWAAGVANAADVPVGPVNDVAEILADPHVRARQLVGSFDYPGVGEFGALALPYKFLGWDNPGIGRPPTLGEHTEKILAEVKP